MCGSLDQGGQEWETPQVLTQIEEEVDELDFDIIDDDFIAGIVYSTV